MGRHMIVFFLTLAMTAPVMTGCSRELLGGAALGAAGAGAAYEYQHKEQMERLDEDFEAGRIDREEYERRKDEIESGSLIY